VTKISSQALSIKGTDESTLVTDSSVPFMRHDTNDLRSLILILIMPKGRILDDKYHSYHSKQPSLVYAQMHSTRYFREKCQTVISNSQKRLEGFKRIKFQTVVEIWRSGPQAIVLPLQLLLPAFKVDA